MSSAQGQSGKCISIWIHCNRCFENYNDKQRIFYILSCFHVTCEKCVTIINKNDKKCSICKNTVKGYSIGNDLTRNLKELFHPRPWTLSFPKAWNVLKFQTKQRNNFLIGCQKLKEYIKVMEKERDRVKEECKQIYFRQEKIKKEKAKLAAGLKKLKEISLSKRYAQRGMEKSHSLEQVHHRTGSDFKFGMQRINTHHDTLFPSTCHVTSRSRDEYSFDFPVETSLSKSFYL